MLWIVLQYEVNQLVDAHDKTTISQTCKQTTTDPQMTALKLAALTLGVDSLSVRG